MITSRSLDALEPSTRQMATTMLSSAEREGIQLLVTCTHRDFAAQAQLYAIGRTAPGKIITNAKPGHSWHNWRRAFDVVPMRHGKPVWGTSGEDLALWTRVGELGEAAGLEWAGRWARFREFPHFQFADGQTIAGLLRKYPEGAP